MAAVGFGGAALARGCSDTARAMTRFLRGLNVHIPGRSLVSEAAATFHSDESSNLQDPEEAVQRVARRIYLVNQHEPTYHELPGALKALRAYSLAAFEETVEVSLCCKLKTKKGKNRDPFRGNIIFPHRFGKEPKVLVFAEGPAAEAARAAGAEIVGGSELIEKVLADEVKGYELCLASRDLEDMVKPLQKKLRKLMPTTRRGTIVDPTQMEKAVVQFKGSREYKCDKQGNCNVAIGKLGFEDHMVDTNLRFLVRQVREHRDTQPKSAFIQKVVLSSTYGPGFLLSMKDTLQS